jgi:uncharacterized protein YdhG (YjbR/CyaY superfamily)
MPVSNSDTNDPRPNIKSGCHGYYAASMKSAGKQPKAGGARTRSAEIDAYIAARPPAVRAVLRRIRAAAHRAAPEAVEVISYRIPALKQRRILIYFAAFTRHIGVFPPLHGNQALARKLRKYLGPKGNLRFPLDAPVPYDLIEEFVRARVKSK